MVGFTFGGTSTAVTTTTNLFGTVSKPLFGTSATCTTASQSAGLFGATMTTPVFSTALSSATLQPTVTASAPFGVTSTAAAKSLLPSITTGGSMFGTTSLAANTTGFFNKPTTGLFGASTSATDGIFTAPTTASPSKTIGLGGTSTLATSVASTTALGAAGPAASCIPMEGEVPQVIMDLVSLLKERIKKNRELSDQFALNRTDLCLKMEAKLDELKRLRVAATDGVRSASMKANELLEKVEKDVCGAERAQKRQKQLTKNPNFGNVQAFDYLQSVCDDHCRMVEELKSTLQSLEEIIDAKLNNGDKKVEISAQDFMKHLAHYDQVFKAVCADVYQCNVLVQDLKETFLEYRAQSLPYTPNPFVKHHESRGSDAQNRFQGADAFPSLVTIMQIGEMAKAAALNQQPASSSTFGTTGSLFGSKPFGATSSPFGATSSNTAPSLFKPFTATTTAPLFGSAAGSAQGIAPQVPTTSSAFTFGNTLNSSFSGTLFGGSASKPFGK